MKNINITIHQAIFASQFLNTYDLTPSARTALLCLISHYNCSSGALYPSLDLIAKESGLKTRKQAIRAIKDLEDNNIIAVLRGIDPKTNKPQNYYQLKIEFIQNLINCFDSVKKSLYNMSMRDKLTRFLVSICPNDSVKMTQKHEHKHERNNKSNFFPKTDFQRRNSHIFEILSEYKLSKCNSLKPYERQEFLDNEWKEHQRTLRLQQEKEEQKFTEGTAPSEEFKALGLKLKQKCLIN